MYVVEIQIHAAKSINCILQLMVLISKNVKIRNENYEEQNMHKSEFKTRLTTYLLIYDFNLKLHNWDHISVHLIKAVFDAGRQFICIYKAFFVAYTYVMSKCDFPVGLLHFQLFLQFCRCDNKQECKMWVNSDVFGDPCPGTHKYVEVHFACAPRILATTTKRPLPPWFLQGGADNLWNNPKKLSPTTSTTTFVS